MLSEQKVEGPLRPAWAPPGPQMEHYNGRGDSHSFELGGCKDIDLFCLASEQNLGEFSCRVGSS